MATSVLIFGMGFVGRALAQSLYQHHYDVAAIKRHQTSDDICLPISLTCMDLNLQAACTFWANYATWVILLPPAALHDYVATMQWLAAQAQAMNVAHIVFASSVGVFGDKQGKCDECTEPQPSSASGQTLLAAERMWAQSGIEHLDILRLGGLYAAERHPVVRLSRQDNPHIQAKQPANRIHRDAAVAALEWAIANPNALRVRHIVEPDYLTKQDFYAREAKKMGVAAPHLADDLPEFSGKWIVSRYTDWQA